MESILFEEDLFNIGIGCCYNHQAATVGSQREIKYTRGEQNAVTLTQPAPRARLAGRISSSLLRSPKHLMASFTTSSTESFDENNGVDTKNFYPDSNSVAGCVSTTQSAQLVADEYFRQGPGPELFSMPPLLDDNEEDSGDINCHGTDGTETTSTCSKSCRSTPSLEDAVALQVGLNAHEYLEECFTEVSVLNRDKFNATPEIIKSDFTITEHLGRGSFSDVFEVVCKGGQLFDTIMSNTTPGGMQLNHMRSMRSRSSSINLATLSRPCQCGDHRLVFAMKCLRPQIRSDADQFTIGAEDLVHETAILANLNHRHIIKLHGRAAGHLMKAFVLNDGYFILLDRLNETLHDRIDAWKQTEHILQGSKVKQMEVAHSIADAMSYLHSKNIVFRDLKPANAGFDYMGVMKLFDFGFATGLPEKNENNPAGFLYHRCGTPLYMAPEVGLSLGYGTKADVYSFGILLWEMCALARPFSSIASSDEFQRAVFMGGKRLAIGSRWPTTIKELISSCWSANPSERQTMLDIKSSLSLVVTNITTEKKLR